MNIPIRLFFLLTELSIKTQSTSASHELQQLISHLDVLVLQIA
jgi:hypothetical protein